MEEEEEVEREEEEVGGGLISLLDLQMRRSGSMDTELFCVIPYLRCRVSGCGSAGAGPHLKPKLSCLRVRVCVFTSRGRQQTRRRGAGPPRCRRRRLSRGSRQCK